MRTTERTPVSRHVWVAAATAASLLTLMLAGAPGARAGIDPSPFRPWLGISAASGAFYAGQGSFRSLYGDVQAAIHIQADVHLSRKIFLFAGFRTLQTKGATAVIGTGIADEHYSLEFRVSSIRAGLGFRLPIRRFALRLGVGGSFNSVRERWLDFPEDEALKAAGFFGNIGFGFELGRRWEIFSRLEYATIPTDSGSALQSKVNLGGFEAVLGLMFKL